MTFTLAHISDVHLAPISGFGLAHANVKRVLGMGNWLLKRRHIHRAEAVAAIVADLKHHRPDHVAVTGDLVNLGLPGEYADAARWLAALGPPPDVTVVPGNHDIYVRLNRDPGIERWRDYMRGAEPQGDADRGFPFVRRLGPVALIGLNSALPRPPFYASGRLGAAQLTALGRTLDRLWSEGLARVVLIHHPPLPGHAPPRRALADAAELTAILERHGAEVVLHGHNHVDRLTRHQTHTGEMAVIGIASGSAGRRHKSEPLARYNVLRFDTVAEGLRIGLVARGFAEPGGEIVEVERRDIGLVRLPSRAPSAPEALPIDPE